MLILKIMVQFRVKSGFLLVQSKSLEGEYFHLR